MYSLLASTGYNGVIQSHLQLIVSSVVRLCAAATRNGTDCLVFNAEKVILSRVQVLAPMVLKPRPIPMPAEIGYSLRRGRGGSLDCMWDVQTHSGPPVFLVLLRKDLARMNGTPQPNRKWQPALGIEPGTLHYESQPLTIGPFLTPGYAA